MTVVKSIKNVESYKWGENCNGWHLLKTNSLSVIQEKMPSGTAERKHYHHFSQQLFFILSGTATFDIEGQEFVLSLHESIHVLPGVKHFIANKGEYDLEFLVISEPKSHGDRIDL